MPIKVKSIFDTHWSLIFAFSTENFNGSVSNLEMLCFLLSLILDISDIRAFIKVMIKPELKRFPLDIFQLHCRRFENRISNYSIFSLGSHTSMIFYTVTKMIP